MLIVLRRWRDIIDSAQLWQECVIEQVALLLPLSVYIFRDLFEVLQRLVVSHFRLGHSAFKFIDFLLLRFQQSVIIGARLVEGSVGRYTETNEKFCKF